MSIDRLSSTAALIAALRGEVLRKAQPSHIGAKSRPSRAVAQQPSNAPAVAQLRNQLIEMVEHVDPADSQAVRQARNGFVRAVLVWEFGTEIREHPEWRSLMEYIESTLDADEIQKHKFLHLLTTLKNNRSR